jgi:hypothetical protein
VNEVGQNDAGYTKRHDDRENANPYQFDRVTFDAAAMQPEHWRPKRQDNQQRAEFVAGHGLSPLISRGPGNQLCGAVIQTRKHPQQRNFSLLGAFTKIGSHPMPRIGRLIPNLGEYATLFFRQK